MPLRLFIDKLYINTTSLSRKSETLHPTARTNNLALFLFFSAKVNDALHQMQGKKCRRKCVFSRKSLLFKCFSFEKHKPDFLLFLQVLFRPAFLYGEVTAPDGKGPVGNVLVYRCTARHKTVVAYFEGCYEVGVAPDKAVFAY